VYGDGLEVAGSALVPKVNDGDAGGWPYVDLDGTMMAGDISVAPTFMGKLVRHESGLWGPPDHTARRAGAGETLQPDTLINVTSAGWTSPASSVFSLVNPSKARRMLVHRSMVGVIKITTPVGGEAGVQLQARINGGSYTPVRSLSWPTPTTGTQNIQFEGELTKAAASILAPEATFTVQLRIVVTKIGATANPVVISASAAVELLGVTI
jgi:hypothetical protein